MFGFWKYEIISRVEQHILHSFALLTREISWSTLELNFIFPHIHYSLFTIRLLSCKSFHVYSLIVPIRKDQWYEDALTIARVAIWSLNRLQV